MKAVILVAKTESSVTWKLDSSAHFMPTITTAKKLAKQWEKEYNGDYSIDIWTAKEYESIPKMIENYKRSNIWYRVHLLELVLNKFQENN